MQSADYVPGVRGIRLNLKTGSFEINSGGVPVGSLLSEPQTITVTAGEWADSDMPTNAIERYRFIGDKLMEVPCQYRDSAEFSTEDASFDSDGSDVRTRLTYQRLETAEEAKARASLPADSVVISDRGDVTITSRGRVVVRLGCWNDDEKGHVPRRSGSQDQHWAATSGIGVDVETSDQLVERLASCIEPLKFEIIDPIDQIRRVIREELRPGGLLHRR
ncbi:MULTISPECIES: hypothetical protein [unclassified Pseudomonas]|uniref:hypothetical protein n=1 Tax=unclassified Pseudomonas TaxID=196821 RepID=UPI0021BA9B62|nr:MULTISPECIES: hypothetical protein [unclassified Pseudomonas]MCT8165634.1 hypothetical protein [Pseudomonas sp. HD6422]MCT8183616.1 hypothetical protein [Pseudomonas sp. HD6421]